MDLDLGNYLGVFSSVEIKDLLLLQSSDLYDDNIPESHHLYMIFGFEKFYVDSVTKNETKENELIVKVKTADEALELIWEDEKNIVSFDKSLDNRCVIINGVTYQILDLILDSIIKNGNQIVSEILYIGQAKGRTESRNTGKRLASHKTLQRILADCHDYKKDVDVRVVSFSIGENVMWTTLTTPETSNAKIEDIYEPKSKEFKLKISDASLINLVEAKLINYLKPEYNDVYKNKSVPSKEHKTYIEYNKFFNSMNIDLSKLDNFYFKQPNIDFNRRRQFISNKLNPTEYMEIIRDSLY